MSRANPDRQRAHELRKQAQALEQRVEERRRRERERERREKREARQREQNLKAALRAQSGADLERIRDYPGAVNSRSSSAPDLDVDTSPFSMEQMSEAAERELQRRRREKREARAPSGLLDRLQRALPSWVLPVLAALGGLALLAVV